MNFRCFPSFLRVFLVALAVLASGASLRAQYEIGVKLNKETYLTYEGVEATVTITNRSGADVVMGGPNGAAWLSFDITDPQGRSVPPMRFNSEENIIFKSGATISRKVPLTDQFTFSEYGNYIVVANVYHPPTQQYYASNRARANFTDTTPMKWRPSFGVPVGLPGAGQIRRYELSILRDTDHTYLYVRLIDEKTSIKLVTQSLGTVIMVIEPQASMDRENRMHVLFMAAPHVYAHVCVDTQGKIIKREYFKEVETNRPKLITDASQSVTVQGGQPYDPTVPAVTRPAGRSVKDRPPGL